VTWTLTDEAAKGLTTARSNMLPQPLISDRAPLQLFGADEPRATAEDAVPLLVALLAVLVASKRRRGPSKVRDLRTRKILAVLDAEEPRTAKVIAKLTGMKDDGHLRGILSDLKRQGKVTRPRGSWGYVLVPTSPTAETKNVD
jgi:hypothetical protein